MTHDHGDMVWRQSAVDTVLEMRQSALVDHPTEQIELDQLSGRVLAEPIVATTNIPDKDRATMDGYAFDANEDYPLSLIGKEVYPADEPPSLNTGEAVEVATGASIPPEANAVLKREEANVDERQLYGTDIEPGTYTYERGSNVTAGDQLFDRGERLSPKDAILLGDLGYNEIEVVKQFSVGIFATGTEIHKESQRDLDSNMLANLVHSWGHKATYEGTAPDEYQQVEAAIEDLAERYDVILTTGGTSVGHKDHVVQVLHDLGDVHFHRVRVRPGKPIAAATIPEANATVFAIPGKPIGAHTISTLVVRPFFTGRTDLPTVSATLQVDIDLGPEGFEYVIPVLLEGDTATPLGHVNSPLEVYDRQFNPSVLSSSTRASRADGFVVAQSALSAGESVDVILYPVIE